MKELAESKEPQIKFVTERRAYSNQDFVRIVNAFGHQGGFENILQVIQTQESSIEVLFYLIDCLGKIGVLFHKSFIDNFLDRLRSAVLKKIITASEA
jgi:hypothetical protein